MSSVTNPGRQRRCPVCGKSRVAEHAPFCSTACRDRDLLRWMDEGYAIPGRFAPVAGTGSGSDEDDEGSA